MDVSRTPSSPQLGLFWFVRTARSRCSFVCLARAFADVEEIGGFKTLDEGHVDVWRSIQKREPSLRSYEYEHFPRGRVNWRAYDDRWLLLLDPCLTAPSFVSFITERWSLPTGKLTISTDPHYRSTERINAPGSSRSS
jgi:hypothetical protein